SAVSGQTYQLIRSGKRHKVARSPNDRLLSWRAAHSRTRVGPSGRACRRMAAAASLYGDKADQEREHADDEARLILDREDQRVVVHLAAARLEPDAVDPIESPGAEKPQRFGVPVELRHVVAIDIEGNDEHGEISARDAHGTQRFRVARRIAAARKIVTGDARELDLGCALDEREAQEEKHRERE